MIARQVLQIVVFTLGAFLVVLAGCAGTSPPSNFYVLSTLPESAAETRSDGDLNRIAVGIGPVILPDYLDRSQIVTRTSPNELKVAAFDRWAEPLKSSFPRILMENLAILLNTDRVAVYPWRKAIPIEYQVVVDVVRFDASPGGNAVLVARWSLLGNGGDKLHLIKKSTFRKTTGSKDYEAMVSAQSQLVIELSREIAAAIKAISR
ncbi:MAG: membrane integrity-associated transporter subunit PqiC [Deltaproteobacteria bacterium]|nr:membrane integrity-associated transporter subunit PqiC [Deltaproteobacteria bacterium]